jgi:uncharacterized protein
MQLPILETNLDTIAKDTAAKEQENAAFITLLKKLNSQELDAAVQRLEQQITPAIDCTLCGNCCKSLMIGLNTAEADAAARFLALSRENFDDAYVEKSLSGKMLMSAIPCHFLSDNKCTIYEHRFAGCREFPALHLPEVQNRLFTIFMHYDRCPIIYNVMEALKTEVHFETPVVSN